MLQLRRVGLVGTLLRTLDYESKIRRDSHGVFQGVFHRFFTGRLENHMGNAMKKTSPRPPSWRGTPHKLSAGGRSSMILHRLGRFRDLPGCGSPQPPKSTRLAFEAD